jgi:hypothetical protein
MIILVTLRIITGELQVHDSAPHIIFQPTNTIFVSADLWLLNIELDISNHSGYIADVERAAAAQQTKNSLYHTAVNAYDQSFVEYSQHPNIKTLNSKLSS